jgi:YihY family inner membrane protein
MLSVLVLGVAFMASFFMTPILRWVSSAVNIANHQFMNALLEMVLGLLTTYVIYRVFPNKSVKWQTALIAAVISTSLIEIIKIVFTGYLGSAFANYGAVYGSLAWIVALAFWAYIVSMLFFLGAEVAVELRRREVF